MSASRIGALAIALLAFAFDDARAQASEAAASSAVLQAAASETPAASAAKAPKAGKVEADADSFEPGDKSEVAARPARVERRAAAADPVHEAEVSLANRPITVLRGTFYGVSAEGRAKRAELALRELAAQPGEGKVTVRAEPQGHVLLVDGQLALILIAEDADRPSGQTLGQASSAARAALQLALQETREGRELKRIVRDGLVSLVATLVAAVLALLARWLRDKLIERLQKTLTSNRALLKVGGVPMLQTERLIDVARVGVRVVYWAIVLILAYQWLSFVLSQFPYTRPWGERLTHFLIGIVARLGGAVLHALPDLLVAVLIFVIARGVIAMSRPIFARFASYDPRGSWLNADTVRPTEKLFRLGVVLFALVMAYPYLPGSGSEAFKGVSVLVGLMLTLGGSSIVAQSVSGLVLMYSRTLRVGEYVRIDVHEGTVTHLGTLTTRLRTGMGEELTLPNSLVLGTVTRNFSREASSDAFFAESRVTIGYDAPWRQVEAMLVEAALRTPGVLAEPPPRVFQTALSDFYPEYRLVCQATPTDAVQRAAVLSMLRAKIQDVFNENGVQIMSPHYLGDPGDAKVVPPAEWHRPIVPRAPEPEDAAPGPPPVAIPGR